MSTRATEAESVLKEHMGYLPVSEMERRGVSRTEISRFVREAKLEKAAKGLYVSPNAESDPLFELQYRYPKAIFSHETALFLLGEGERAPLTPTITWRVLVIVATPDLPQGGSGDQKPPKRRPCVLLQCLFDRFGSVFPQCGLMVFPGVVIVSR